MITRAEAQLRVDGIRWISQDNESAHSEEDSLYRDVLATIADPGFDNMPLARDLAVIALSTQEIDFARWCA